MKKVIFAVIMFTFMIGNVYAGNYSGSIVEGEKIDGIYYYKHRNDTDEIKYEYHNFHKEATIYKRTTDNEIVYCIESWEPLSGNSSYDYDETTDYTKTKLTNDQKERINRIAYYGYGYNENGINHTDKKWYAITQYMIWCIQSPNIEHYFVSSISSTTPIYPYQNEIEEINRLVDNSLKLPNITLPTELFIGEEYHYYDSNNVLNNYSSISSSALSTSIEGDTLTIKVLRDSFSKNNIILNRKYDFYGNKEFEYYTSDYYQDCMSVGSLNNQTLKSQALIRAGEINVYLYTRNATTRLREYIPDITVYLYDKKTNKLLDSKKTNIYGKVLFNELYTGEYYFKIEETDEYLEEPIRTVSSSLDNYYYSTDIELYKQELDLNINNYIETKQIKENRYVYNYEKGKDYEFGLYDENDNLLYKYTTDEDGIINTHLRINYGTYYIKELTDSKYYKTTKDKYYFEFKKVGHNFTQKISIDIKNDLKKSNLTIHKVDSKTIDNLSNVGFLILNEDKNLVYKSTTDDNGLIKVLLPYGSYYIKEYKTIDNYILNKDLLEVNLLNEEEYYLVKNDKIEENNINLSLEEEITTTDNINDEYYIDIDVPKTLSNDYSYLIILFSFIILLCIRRS